MSKYFWYKTCPSCNGQGRLIITSDITNDRLYLHCEECEMGWINPKDVDDVKKGFLTLDEDFETENPTYEKILQYGWQEYAVHCFEEGA